MRFVISFGFSNSAIDDDDQKNFGAKVFETSLVAILGYIKVLTRLVFKSGKVVVVVNVGRYT